MLLTVGQQYASNTTVKLPSWAMKNKSYQAVTWQEARSWIGGLVQKVSETSMKLYWHSNSSTG